MKATKKLTDRVINTLQEAVRGAFGNEILAVGTCDGNGMVAEIHIAARGDGRQVPALTDQMERGEVIIHNHPSGDLTPSGPDMQVASELGRKGIGFYIIDNPVVSVYAVSEPVLLREITALDPVSLCSYLDSGGPVASMIDGFIPRGQQLEMLEEVTSAFNHDEISVIEAGTGVGKSFAYLVPAVFWADRNRERVIISTNTINLQQQLMEKDLPVIVRSLGKEIKYVLAKGRSNYLCLRRLEEARREVSLFRDLEDDLERISEWAEKTRDGSRTDLSFQPSHQVWNTVCSESDTCLGLKCGRRDGCFVLRARKEAAAADIIIANHHLLFADLSMKMEELGFDATAILPPCTRYIYDEAHTMEEAATSFFSKRITRYQLVKQGRRLIRRQGKEESGILTKLYGKLEDEKKLRQVEELVRGCFSQFDIVESSALLFLNDSSAYTVGEGDLAAPVFENLKGYHRKILELIDAMIEVLKEVPQPMEEEPEVFELETVLRRFELIAENCFYFLEERNPEDNVYWLEKTYSYTGETYCNFIITPLDLSPLLYDAVFQPNKTVVCTSATLTVSKKFTFWKKQVGLDRREGERIRTKLLDSPFPYETNVLLGIPNDGPDPQQPDFTSFITELVVNVLRVSEGRGLVLFTSYAMMNEVYGECKSRLEAESITSFKQGEEDRNKLLKHFVDNVASVLFATASFWQGIDAPGQTCTVVILVKLPFKVPTEPVIKARLDRIKRLGGNPFFEMSLPDAVMKLKQGFGRLMRKQDDRGIIVISDPRIIRKNYGAFFLNSLPGTARSVKESALLLEDIERFLYG